VAHQEEESTSGREKEVANAKKRDSKRKSHESLEQFACRAEMRSPEYANPKQLVVVVKIWIKTNGSQRGKEQ
jgi:hypothetical protein